MSDVEIIEVEDEPESTSSLPGKKEVKQESSNDYTKLIRVTVSSSRDSPVNEEETEDEIYDYKKISGWSPEVGEYITLTFSGSSTECSDEDEEEEEEIKFAEHIYCCNYCSHVSFSRLTFKKHLQTDHGENSVVDQPEESKPKIKSEFPVPDPPKSEIKSIGPTINLEDLQHYDNRKGPLYNQIRSACLQKLLKSTHSKQKEDYHVSDSPEVIEITEENPFSQTIIHEDELKRFKCPQCDFRSNYPTSIRRHINIIHAKQKPHACDQCPYRTYLLRQLKLHIAAKHSSEKGFSCPMCEYQAVQERYLKRHITAVHTDEGRHPCPLCDFSTVYTEYLKHHIRAKHTSERPFTCPHCDQTFALSGHLRNHVMSIHKKIKRYACDLCDYRCAQSGDLRRHKNARHSQKQFTCPYCEYRSATVYQLRTHTKSVHSIKNQ